MKKIALIMDGWKRFFTYAWPSGILSRLREKNEDVNLYIFNSSGDWSWDSEYNEGEYNIYNLPNFDDFDKAMFYEPRITTVSHIREDVGYKCADILIKIWNNEKVDRFTYTDVKPIYLESCGCKCDAKISYIKHAKKKIMYDIETEDFDEQILALEYDLLNCKSIREISERILFCKPILKCESMFLVLDKHLNDFSKYNKDFNSYIINDNKFRTSGYPKEMVVEFSYDIDSGYSWQSNVIDALFPTFECEDRCSSFLFIPLHFRNYTVGYFVAKNAEYLMEKQYLFRLINTITSAMKNLYEKQKLEYMNHMLEEMSIKDSMTGLYNRTGFQKYAQALFDYKKNKKRKFTYNVCRYG